MALLGTKVDTQCGSYIPGYYSVRDFNLDANGSTWPLKNVGIIMNGQYYNGTLLPSSPDQNMGYNKEVFKHTMLKHEAIFKDQIHELHRLYRRQRELMDEMKKNELYKHHLQLETLQSNPVLSQNSIEFAQKTWHVHSLPWMKPTSGQSSGKNNLLPVSFAEGNSMQAGADPAQTEGFSKDSELLESKCKMIGNKTLDLQLPADVYIESEEEESVEEENVPNVPEVLTYPLKKISQGLCAIDVKPSLGSGSLNSVFQEDNMNSSSFSRKTKVLVDLNEPVKLEEEAALKSSDILEPVTRHGDIPCRDLSGETDSALQFLYKGIIPNIQTGKDPEACSSVLHPKKNEKQQESLSYDDEPGQSRCDLNSFPQGFCEENAFMSFEDVELKQALGLPTSHLLDESNIESSSQRKSSNVESPRDLPTKTYTGTVGASDIGTSNQLVPPTDVENSPLPLVFSQRKPRRELQRAPIIVQALPCFNTSKLLSRSLKSPIGSPGLSGCKRSSTKNVKPCPKYNSASFPWRRFCNGSQSESKTLEAHPLSISDGLNCSDDNNSASEHHGPTKCINGSKDVRFPMDVDLNFTSPGCSLDVSAFQNDQITDGEMELEDSSGVSPFEASPAKIHQCPSEDKDIENTEKYGVLDMNLDGDQALDSGKQLTANELVVDNQLDKKISGFRFRIDMNSFINEDESSPTASQSAEMDLQAPVSPENKESSPPRGESDENQLEVGGSDENQLEVGCPDENQLEMSFQLSEQENGDPQEDLVSIAVEVIATISSAGVKTCLESATCEPSEVPWIESLHWFAKVVSSAVDDPEGGSGVALGDKDSGDHDHEDCLFNGIDYFEAMTLQLTETKVEDCLYNSNVQKEEETKAISLPSQPKRGRTRRGRQHRKDFQSEILPSLASLSRYEVTEDLQTIGGLIEAAGSHSGSSRYAGRNGLTRGRRRSCVSSSNVRENTVNLLPKQQPSNPEMAIEERSLIYWGKITRRRRGQRRRATNLRPILGQG